MNNYSPKAKWILWNNPRDEVERHIPQYSLSICCALRSFNRDYQLFKSIEKRREADILKFSALIIITSREVIKARYSVILNQSERAHLYNRWAIILKAFIRRIRSCFTNVCYIASRSLFLFCWRPHTILITTTQALIPIVFKYRLTMKSFLHCKCLHYFLLVPIKPIGYFQYF